MKPAPVGAISPASGLTAKTISATFFAFDALTLPTRNAWIPANLQAESRKSDFQADFRRRVLYGKPWRIRWVVSASSRKAFFCLRHIVECFSASSCIEKIFSEWNPSSPQTAALCASRP